MPTLRVRRSLWIALAALLGVLAGPAAPALAQCGPDLAFGGDGVVVSDLGSSDEAANALAVLPDGTVVVAGSSAGQMTAARYLPDGSLDPTFGTGGVVRVPNRDPLFSASALDVAVQPDGKVVLVGRAFGGVSETSGADVMVARLNPDGTLDASFGGGDGVVYLDLGRQEEAEAVVVDSAGRIVVAGRTWTVNGDSDALVARFLPDGSLDRSFGRRGVVRLELGSNFDAAHALALQPDGSLLVAGSYQPSSRAPWLARLGTDGRLDRGFGNRGLVTGEGGAWYDVAVLPDGRIVTAGEGLGGLTVARYLPSGQPDPSFGTGGVASVQVDPAGFLSGQALALAVRPDGGIIAVGSAWTTGWSEMLAVALTPEGAPDARFGQAGVVRQPDPVGWLSGLTDVALLPDGSALAVGFVGYDWALARYTACG